MEVEKALCPASIPLPYSFVPHSSGSSWVIFTHSQLFHFAFPFTPCAGVCTLLVRPFHASAALFPFLLGTTSSFHSAWEDGLVPMIIATAIAGCCGPFGTGSGFFVEDVRSQPSRQMLRGRESFLSVREELGIGAVLAHVLRHGMGEI
eukprot:Gb_40181 [translate_table: standard]